jgi:hypothetical protein
MAGAFQGRTPRNNLPCMYIVLFFVVECLRRLKGRREKKGGKGKGLKKNNKGRLRLKR